MVDARSLRGTGHGVIPPLRLVAHAAPTWLTTPNLPTIVLIREGANVRRKTAALCLNPESDRCSNPELEHHNPGALVVVVFVFVFVFVFFACEALSRR